MFGRYTAFFAALIGSAMACSSTEGRTATWWINSFKVPCVGVAPMQCLQVHEGEQAFGEWRLFYGDIAGFDYKPGSLYRIKVRVTELPRTQLPADASSLRYELLEVIEQISDPRAPLHDIFVLTAIGRENVERDGATAAQATIEFNIVTNRYAGNDGCREFQGEIIGLDATELRLGPATTGDTACPSDIEPTALLLNLNDVAAWRRDGMSLELLDDTGSRRLLFRKVD